MILVQQRRPSRTDGGSATQALYPRTRHPALRCSPRAAVSQTDVKLGAPFSQPRTLAQVLISVATATAMPIHFHFHFLILTSRRTSLLASRLLASPWWREGRSEPYRDR